MATESKLVVFPVKDAARAKALYSALLGTEPYVDQPYYVGYRVDGQEIGLDPNGHRQGLTGPVPYWDVDDVQASVAALLAAGAETLQAPRDVGGGKQIALIKDADGNVIGLAQNP